jgi:ubiquinone/menaquinone biosynthesis C-methylase UbiE
VIPDYNRVAPFYDRLAKIVFGRKHEEAKMANLDLIKANHRILIVGGGSGQLLKYIDQKGIRCKVDYIDISKAMLQRARRHKLNNIDVRFYEADILEFLPELTYDIICTNFFFDQFNEKDCLAYLNQLRSSSHKHTKLLYADFVHSKKLTDRVILKLMYGFFQVSTGLGKVQLIDHKTLFQKSGLKLLRSRVISSQIVSAAFEFD